MKSNFFIALILIETLFISHLNGQTAIIAAKLDLINQFKDSEIPRIYKSLKNIKSNDISESKKKGFIKWKYSVTSCHGQLSEFNPSQVQINLNGNSNTIEIRLKDFKFYYNCHARVKSIGISISGNVKVKANVPLIRVVLSPGLFDREKGFKSILFKLQQSHVDINPKHDMNLRISIKNCPRFIESAIESIVIRTMNNKIRNIFNDELRKSVTKGLQRLAEKTDLQTVIPDTNVALTYSFYKPPLITDHQIIFYLDSHFYPLNIGLQNGKIPVPQRFRDTKLQLPQIDSQQQDNKFNNSYLFYHVSLINSGLWAAAIAKRTYIINNKFMRLFNSRQIINTTFLRQLIPEIGFYDEENITVKVFLVPDEMHNTAKLQQDKILLDLKFQAEFLLSNTQQEIMSIIIHAGFLFTELRGEKGDGQNSMMDVYGLIEDINLIDFDILHTSQALTEKTYDNMKTIIETFFILAQALVNRDFMRYPYQIPVKVLDIVKVGKSQAYFSEKFGLITAGITGQ